MELTQRDARKLFLKQQGLLRGDEFGRGRQAVLRAVKRLSYLQIDSISVVNRAHEHVMYSRVGNFQPAHLDRLIRERHLYEYWGHAAAYLPFEHFRFSIPVMKGWQSSRRCDARLAAAILHRIRTEGPLQSKDFEDTRQRKRNGWWQWKPAKQVLEHLFLTGELMVTRRDKFQKVFDLRENVIPDRVDTREPTIEEWSDHIVLGMVNALGVATERDLGYAKSTIRRLAGIELKAPIGHAIARLRDAGRLVMVSVQGRPCYSTDEILAGQPLRASKNTVRILSPFDNLIINRRRTSELFDFDYQLECYLPAAKRKYGYFALPLLYGDALIGRLDARADRKHKRLAINHLTLEPGVKVTDRLLRALGHGIGKFAADHGCNDAGIDRCSPAGLKAAVAAAVRTAP